MELLPYKEKHKLRILKNLRVPWRWPTDKAETCQSIVQKVGVKFCVGFIVVIYEERKTQRTAFLTYAL